MIPFSHVQVWLINFFYKLTQYFKKQRIILSCRWHICDHFSLLPLIDCSIQRACPISEHRVRLGCSLLCLSHATSSHAWIHRNNIHGLDIESFPFHIDSVCLWLNPLSFLDAVKKEDKWDCHLQFFMQCNHLYLYQSLHGSLDGATQAIIVAYILNSSSPFSNTLIFHI